MNQDMEKHRAGLLDLLHGIVQDHPKGITEYDLLGLLKEHDLPFFSDHETIDTLALFQNHFLLFHLLYLLRDRLYEQKNGDLQIHCLKIILLPWTNRSEKLPGPPDTLRDYYRDLTALETMDQFKVDDLLKQFWERYLCFDKGPESLAILGLAQGASQLQIKKRFRELAHRHHPDQGGDPEKFRQIRQAADTLLSQI